MRVLINRDTSLNASNGTHIRFTKFYLLSSNWNLERSLDKKISLEPIFKTDRVIGSRIFFALLRGESRVEC